MRSILITLFVFVVFALSPTPAHAQLFLDWESSGCLEGAEKVATLRCLPIVFQNVVTALLLFAGVVAVYFIIFAGFKYVTSGGDPKQLEGARHTLTYAIIGLVIILLSFFIINVIGYVTGASNCITQFGFEHCR